MLRRVTDALQGSRDIARRALPLLAIGFLADTAFIFIFLIALQSYLPEKLHASAAIAGYALAAFGIAKLCSQVLSGIVSDRLGTRTAMIGGTALLLAADASMLPLAHIAPYAIVAAAAVEGLGSSVLWPALYSAGTSRFEAGEKSRFTAALTLATMAALLTGLGGGALLNMFVPFNIAMLMSISLVAAALTVALRTPVSARERAERKTAEVPSLRELPAVLRSPQRVAFSAIIVAESIALGALTAIFRAYGRDIAHVSLTREGVLLAPAAVLGGLGVVAGGALADRVGARRVMAPGFLVAGMAVLVLAHWTHPATIVVAATAGGVGFGLAVPTIASTMMALAGGAGARGGIIGWFMSMDGLGHSIGPALAALLLPAFGTASVMLLVGASFLAVGAIAVVRRIEDEADTRDDGRRRSVGAASGSPPMMRSAEVGRQ